MWGWRSPGGWDPPAAPGQSGRGSEGRGGRKPGGGAGAATAEGTGRAHTLGCAQAEWDTAGCIDQGGGATDPPAPACAQRRRAGREEGRGGESLLRRPARKWGHDKGSCHVSGTACTEGGQVSVGVAKEMVGGGEPLLRPLKQEGAHQQGSEEENEKRNVRSFLTVISNYSKEWPNIFFSSPPSLPSFTLPVGACPPV